MFDLAVVKLFPIMLIFSIIHQLLKLFFILAISNFKIFFIFYTEYETEYFQ